MQQEPSNGEVGTRERIIRAADDLFYRQGFERTSFADIAEAVQISRGNFYHHFKSKDDILDAVVQYRLDGTQQMLEDWDVAGRDPRARIGLFIDILVRNGPLILKHGCPVGTLCTELAKLEHAALPDASRLFTLFRTWLEQQFESLGRADADLLALRLLARSQGVAVMANAFHDEAFLRLEVAEMHAWLDSSLGDGRPRKTKTTNRQR